MKTTGILFFLLILISPYVFGAKYPLPKAGDDVIGQQFFIRAEPGDTLDQIGDKYGLGLHEMLEANPGMGQNELSGGEEVLIPTQFILPKCHKGIIINVAEVRLYYFTPDGHYVLTYPVGLGRHGWRTPTTSTIVTRKTTNPVWTVPSTIRAYVLKETGKLLPNSIPPGPENPLGPYALYLGKNGYLIHGTNQPWSIGKLISAGCVRLNNPDVAELYRYVKTGTPVKIVHYPYKAGWHEGKLYLEAHIPLKLREAQSDLNITSLDSVLKKVMHKGTWVDRQALEEVLRQSKGTPELIGMSDFVKQSELAENSDIFF